VIQVKGTWYQEAFPIEVHTPADPMCQHPILQCRVTYIPRVGDLLWHQKANYKVIQVAQWAEDHGGKHQGYEQTYTGRVCVMVEMHSLPERRDA
jgi:hypothetical protein